MSLDLSYPLASARSLQFFNRLQKNPYSGLISALISDFIEEDASDDIQLTNTWNQLIAKTEFGKIVVPISERITKALEENQCYPEFYSDWLILAEYFKIMLKFYQNEKARLVKNPFINQAKITAYSNTIRQLSVLIIMPEFTQSQESDLSFQSC